MVIFTLVPMISLYFVGNLDNSKQLAGFGLGHLLLDVLVFAIATGLNCTVDTFMSWAYGSQRYDEVGFHLNRVRIISVVFLLPAVVAFFYVDKILIYLAQDPEVSVIARNYCIWTLPGIFAIIQFDCTMCLLQTLNKSYIAITVQAFTILMHFPWCILFIRTLNMGIFGAACALNVTYIANFII